MSQLYISETLRHMVIDRALNRCEYCQSPADYSPEIFEIEHIQPVSKGGTTELSNLALACPACNRYKGSRQAIINLENNQVTPLFNPRVDRWLDHFSWSDDFSSIEGITDIGQVTVTTLNINRPPVKRFRLALFAVGLHPVQIE